MHNSPLSKIPVEIYGEIFLQYVSMNPHSFWAPLVLAGVCTNWRNAALRLPRLWANLALRGDKFGEKLLDPDDPFYRMVHESADSPQEPTKLRRGLTKVTNVKEWLNRSGGCSLSVQYYQPADAPARFSGFSTPHLTRIDPEFYEAFIPAHERVVQLTLTNLGPASQPEAFQAFQLSAFPKLRTLIIQGQCQLNEILGVAVFPNIRHLQSLVGPEQWSAGFAVSHISSSLPCLTSCNIQLGPVSPADLIKLFNNCHLQEVTLTLPKWNFGDQSTTGKSNSRTSKLHIKGSLYSSSRRLAELYLPKLQVFSWTDAYAMKPSAVRCQLKNLIEKSAPPLHTLIFNHIQLKEKALKETLVALPTVRVLKLHATRISDEFIELLADPTQGLCPDLEVLDVNVQKSPYGFPRVTRAALQSLKGSRDQPLTIIYNGEHI